MKMFKKLISSFFIVGALALPFSAEAITYGEPDCDDNATNLNCAHPNTVSLSGFRLNEENVLVSLGRCSGSLLKKTDDMIIILTAGHCISSASFFLNLGILDELGVSFDAKIEKFPGDVANWPSDQYVLGGIPLLAKVFGPNINAFNLHFDYGIIAFEISDGIPITDGGDPVNLAAIDPVQLPPLGFLNNLVHNVDTMTNVGYGTGEVHGIPGEEPMPGDPSGSNFDTLGVRLVSESLYIGFMGKKRNLVLSSQNLARDNSGACGGDSGGPLFVDDNGEELIVALTSSGDSPCRATILSARLDIAESQDFIQACADDADTIADFKGCKLGCLLPNAQGVCPK